MKRLILDNVDVRRAIILWCWEKGYKLIIEDGEAKISFRLESLVVVEVEED